MMIGILLIIAVAVLTGCGGLDVANSETCKNIADPTYLEHGVLPTTALASFQGSGNTWMRQLLGSSTGYKVGDSYASYGNDVFPEFSSRSDDTVLAVKAHLYSKRTTKKFKRALVIARNPLDALFAEFNRVYGGNKTGYADLEHLLNSDGSPTWKWDAWMAHIASWVDFYTFWLKIFQGPVHVIYYNNLKTNTEDELNRAIEFLKLKPNPLLINCALHFPKSSYFKRKHSKPLVDKTSLFRLSMSKEKQAIHKFKELIVGRFGVESKLYKSLNLTISEAKLHGL